MILNNSQILFGIARTLPHEYIRKYGSTKSIQTAKQRLALKKVNK